MDYDVGDAVYYNGSSYVMITNAAAGTVPTNASFWDILALGGGVAHYEHVQSSASASWTITHNLGIRPLFLVFLDSDPTQALFTDQSYPDLNTTTIAFDSAVTGVAYA